MLKIRVRQKRKEHLFSFLFYAIISAKKKTIKKEEDAMDFYEAVQRRRTVRDFAEKKFRTRW